MPLMWTKYGNLNVEDDVWSTQVQNAECMHTLGITEEASFRRRGGVGICASRSHSFARERWRHSCSRIAAVAPRRARGPFSPRARFRFGVGLSSSVRPQEAASPFSRGCESSEGRTVDHPWQYLRPKILVSKSDQNNVKRSAKLESDDDKIRCLPSKISTKCSAAGLKYRTLK